MRPDSTAVKAKPSFDFNGYMKERAQLIDAALDKSVPLQYPEVINEAMRYSLLAGGCCALSTSLATRSTRCIAALMGWICWQRGGRHRAAEPADPC